MTFGEKVKTLRKEKGLNQTQLAQAVGVSLRTIRGWEIEGRYPKIIAQTAAMFAGGGLSDEDKTAFMDEIQTLYLDSKKRAKKYTPKKYLKED